MRRIACISDIHGNVPALRAVLDDVVAAAVSEVYCLGDLVGYGPDPSGVVGMIRDHAIPSVRGNYDDGIGFRRGECGCFYVGDAARADGEASYAFTDSAIDEGSRDWLSRLPDELRLDTDGLRVLFVHGSPRKRNEYLHADRSDAQLLRLAEQARADLICVGHTHVPYHRHIVDRGSAVDYVNVGSVGKPKDGDPRACWTELILEAGRVEARFHRVSYDIAAVQAAMRSAGLPETLIDALAGA